MKKLEIIIAKAVNSMINIEAYGWPPVCIGMIYQPERPVAEDKGTEHLSCPTKNSN